jgi:hypothetical protein
MLRWSEPKEGCGWQVVQADLGRFIELLFRDSEAYRLALKLYAGRHEMIVARSADEILREAIDKHMPDDKEQHTQDKQQESEKD